MGRPTAAQASKQPFIDNYFHLVQKIATPPPDIDIPINHTDEPRGLVSWDTVAENMEILRSSLGRQDLVLAPLIDTYTTPPPPHAAANPASFVTRGRFWNLARQACCPDTEAHPREVDSDFSTPPVLPTTYWYHMASIPVMFKIGPWHQKEVPFLMAMMIPITNRSRIKDSCGKFQKPERRTEGSNHRLDRLKIITRGSI